jgi:hypothetical protein
MTWAPAECTLPTAERPLRVAEFDELFATSLRGLTRPEPLLLRLVLDDADGIAATTEDLVARERSCCAFFDFELTAIPHGLQLDVSMPAGRTEVLDRLAERAAVAASERLAAGGSP